MSEKSTHTEDHNTTIKLDFEENEHLRILLGERDAHIRLIEEKIGGRIHVRGNHLTVSGDEAVAALAAKLLRELYQVVKRGLLLQTTDVDLAIRTLKNNPAVSLKELFLDTTIPVTTKKRVITPKSVNQKRYIDSIRSFDMVIGIGPAGTGKTYLAVAMAVKAFKAKEVSRIILTRPAVEAGEKLGFLPGDLQQKVDPYLRPLYDGLFDMLKHMSVWWKSRSLRWPRWPICAAVRWTTPSSFWMRRRTPRRSR